jgi:SAM-dependent methyltransferase
MSTPNAELIAYWNGVAGPKWVSLHADLDAELEPLGPVVLRALGPVSGQRLLDVGCGCGTFTLEVARAAGEAGFVCGLDVSVPMLERAREGGAAAGLRNVEFLQADAQTHGFDAGSFDAVVSRFGVMFFDDPVAAFANLRRALRGGGRLAFVCWQPLERNEWGALPLSVAERYVSVERPKPDAPGPFAFADVERVRGVLDAAGFVETSAEPAEMDLRVGRARNAREAAEFLVEIGPTAAALRQHDASLGDKVVEALTKLLLPREKAGAVTLPAAAWLVTART